MDVATETRPALLAQAISAGNIAAVWAVLANRPESCYGAVLQTRFSETNTCDDTFTLELRDGVAVWAWTDGDYGQQVAWGITAPANTAKLVGTFRDFADADDIEWG